MSPINLHRNLVVDHPARVLYTMATSTLVRIGPNLHIALYTLTHGILEAYRSRGFEVVHIATTYSLVTVTLLFDCSPSSRHSGNENGATDVTVERQRRFKSQRLKFYNGKIVGKDYFNAELRERVYSQLESIHVFHPTFHSHSCVRNDGTD